MSLLIKNGNLVTASEEFQADIYVKDGKIAAIGKDLDVKADKVVDATGKFVMPGGVDEHVHYGTFGAHLFETAHAAAVGGTTTIVDFAPQDKGETLTDGVRRQAAKAEGNSSVDYGFHSMMMDPSDAAFEDIVNLPSVGVSGVKLFMAYKGTPFYSSDDSILRAMTIAKKHGITFMVHAESTDIIDYLQKYYLEKGETAPVFHYYSRPPISEDEATVRAINMAKMVDCPLFVVHVTTKGAMEAIRDANMAGYQIFGETCTHYLNLTTDYLDKPGFEGAKYVCAPPLRPQEHLDALWEAVQKKWLVGIGSDHAALIGGYEKAKKKGTDFTNIPNGCPGVQDRMIMIWTYGVCTGKITRQRYVDLMCTTPAKMVGIYPQKGTLAVGSDADICIFEPNYKGVISNEASYHETDYSPYEGFEVKGQFEQVYLRGNLVAEKGKFIEEMRGKGQRVMSKPYAMSYDYYKLRDDLPADRSRERCNK